MSEALSLIEELETSGESLEVERDMLRTSLLRHEFDLCHANATRAILGDRVNMLEAEVREDTVAVFPISVLLRSRPIDCFLLLSGIT